MHDLIIMAATQLLLKRVYWASPDRATDLAVDLVAEVEPLIRADERAKIAVAIRTEKVIAETSVLYDTWNRAIDHVAELIEDVDHD